MKRSFLIHSCGVPSSEERMGCINYDKKGVSMGLEEGS